MPLGVSLAIKSEGDRRELYESIKLITAEQLEQIKKAHEVVDFFSLIEANEICSATHRLKKSPWLVSAYKSAIALDQSYQSPDELGCCAVNPLMALSQLYGKNELDETKKQFAAFLFLYGADLGTQELSDDLKILLNDCQKKREHFAEKWRDDRSVPALDLVYKVDTIEKLKLYATRHKVAEFKQCLAANAWVVDFEMHGTKGLEQHLVDRYCQSMEQTDRLNKQLRTFSNLEGSSSSQALCGQFEALLKKCEKGSAMLFKIDKALFNFYKDPFLHKAFIFNWSWPSLYIEYDDAHHSSYGESRLHKVRRGEQNRLRQFSTFKNYYDQEEVSFVEGAEQVEIGRARLVRTLFCFIETANFSDAFELLLDKKWLAHAQKYSGVPDSLTLESGEIAGYMTNPLGALAHRLSKGNVFEDEREYVKKLGALLLALGVDSTLCTAQYNLPSLLKENSCKELSDLVKEHNNDRNQFSLLYDPPLIEEPEVDEGPELTPEELEAELKKRKEEEKKQQEKEERDEARQELTELEEQVAIVAQGTSYAKPLMQIALLGAVGTAWAVILQRNLLLNQKNRWKRRRRARRVLFRKRLLMFLKRALAL